MKKRFQYGLCEWSVTARGREFLSLASEQKLDCVQLGVGEEVFSGKGLGNWKRIEEYKNAAEELGVTICSISPQFVDQYSFTMPKNFQEEEIAIALVDKTIALCSTFGCENYLLPVLCRNDINDGTGFHRAVEYIKHFTDKAADAGIATLLEVNQSVDQVHNLLDAVDNPNVKIFFDSQNLYALNGTSMPRYFRALENEIGGVHVKDGLGTMLSGSLLGEGNSGFYKTAQTIVDSNYSGPILIESVYSKATIADGRSEAELLAQDVATLYKAFG